MTASSRRLLDHSWRAGMIVVLMILGLVAVAPAAVAQDVKLLTLSHGRRLDTISYGKERPAVLGSNEDAWAQNRRGVFNVN